MGQWSELPSDLLNAIDAQLEYIDKVRVRAVCESWYSSLPNVPNYKLQQLPWLLQAFVNKTETSHGLFNLREEKFYQLDLPEAQRRRLFLGSSHGWVVMMPSVGQFIYASSPDIYLVNPLTRVEIQLPPRYTFPDVEGYSVDRVNEEYHLRSGGALEFFDSNYVHQHFLDKVVTSSTPSSEDCVVVAIYGELGRVAWCARNHKKWTPLDLDVIGDPVEDILFSKNNKLYIVSCHGHLLEVENIGRNPKVTIIAPPPEDQFFSARCIVNLKYLVECCDGSIIMVGRYFGDKLTVGFKVCKFDSMNSTWLVVDNIGDDMLFFGINHSLSISSCDSLGYKGNCIYFTDCFTIFHDIYRKSDIGVFNLEDGSIVRLPGFPTYFWPPPVWVMPPKYH